MGDSQTSLNNAQAQAVQIDRGPALVVAGADTGKTKVIVERISRLLDAGTSPKRLLALTFTEKAAAEMLDRVNELRHGYELDLPIMTFNAYGESLLRRYAADIGLGRNFTLMGDSAQIVFLRERLDQLGLDYFAPVSRPDALLGDLADYFSRLKQAVITPATHTRFADQLPANDEAARLEKRKYQELSSAYETYLKLCREANVIDYDDQIYVLLELFSVRPNILKHVQDSYDYVMVDEFQDTNTMQARLVDSIVGTHHNLFAVGDDDQSIYGWRGATLANILEFKNRYPQAQEVALLTNYRSSTEILNAAYRLIQHNNPDRLETRLGINKQLLSDKHGLQPNVYSFENLEAEQAWIAQDIERRIAAGADPASIAVLARRNTTIKRLHSYLELEQVDHVLIGQRYELYQEPVVRMLLEAVKTVVDPADNISLYHTLSSPLFGIAGEPMSRLAGQAKRNHQSLQSVIQENTDEALEPARRALQSIIDWRAKLGTLSIGQLTYEIVDSSGYKDSLYTTAQDDPDAALAINRLSELFTTMKEFEQIALQPSAIQYVQALPALQAAGDSGEDGTLDLSERSVNLLTIHKSKGLEWPIVYISDCTEGSFPLRDTARGIALPEGLPTAQITADDHIAEERRLMYVAMTRAKDELILSYAERHSTASRRKPSRFLAEAFNPEDIRHITGPETESRQLNQFTIPAFKDVPLPARMVQGNTLSLSVSQVQKYLDCPLDFYYCYILNVPQESSPALEYGTLMHDLLQAMNQSLINGEVLPYASLEERLQQGWPKIGYLSAEQRDRAKHQGRQTLKQLYERFEQQKRLPITVEEAFSFNIPDCKLVVKGS